MHVTSIQSTNTTPNFHAVRLGNGGARRLVESMPVEEAKKFIRNNTELQTGPQTDIMITSKAIEIIPYDRKNIFDIRRIVARGSNFTNIEAFEHGERCLFKIPSRISDSQLKKYGSLNYRLSLVEFVANFINKMPDWRQFLHYDNELFEIAPGADISAAADDITRFNNTHYTF